MRGSHHLHLTLHSVYMVHFIEQVFKMLISHSSQALAFFLERMGL